MEFFFFIKLESVPLLPSHLVTLPIGIYSYLCEFCEKDVGYDAFKAPGKSKAFLNELRMIKVVIFSISDMVLCFKN